ncbi:MAG: UDP-glucuronic acid decarboxylase family protein [Candidatus Brocadiia bacterium]
MRTVVTGAAGFLGSHLCEALVERGHQVVGIDNCLTGSLENLAGLGDSGGMKLIEQDVTHYIAVEGEVDNVLHFASPASPVDYLNYPIPTLKVGSLGTHKACGLAKSKGARFLLASTSEVYGDPLVHPQHEDYWGNVNPVGYRGVYDEAKRFAEAMTMAYHRYHKLDTRIVRIFNTYGPRMRIDDGRALPNFFTQALRGQDLTVYGDGRQTRSFCYVSDTIEGVCRLLEADEHLPVNIGNPQEITILDLAREIIEITGSSSGLRFLPLPESYRDDPKTRRPDISKARRLLGWEPTVARRDGLCRTLAYFRERLGAAT